jgi:zinc resistance-associated protein
MASTNAIKEVAMMKKTIAAGAIVLTLAGAGFALAQQTTQPTTQAREGRGFQRSAEDVAALTDARVAGLKAGLKLTAEQEKNWPAVETAIRDLAKARGDRMTERAARREARRSGGNAQPAGPDAISRLRQGADAMTARAAGLKKLADASEPLYKSLDDGQKRRFGMLLRMGGRQGGVGHHWQRRADNVR